MDCKQHIQFPNSKRFKNFLQQNRKWSEVPYIQAFIFLRPLPSLCKTYNSYQVLLLNENPISRSQNPPPPYPSSLSEFDPTNTTVPSTLNQPHAAEAEMWCATIPASETQSCEAFEKIFLPGEEILGRNSLFAALGCFSWRQVHLHSA